MHTTIPPLKIQRLPNCPEAVTTPRYQSEGAAGMDIQSAEAFSLPSGRSVALHTGLAFEVPAGYEMQVRSRSGLAAKHGVFVTNGIGTIDCDYRGEVMVILTNLGGYIFDVKVGDRIAQLVFAPVYRPATIEVVEDLSATARGFGGFGSTGR